jgi:DNA polymerase III epsilon subunit-like protein
MKIQSVVVDTETTASITNGVDVNIDDIVELTIMPITEDFKIDATVPVFSTLVNPNNCNPNMMLMYDEFSNLADTLPFNNIPKTDIIQKGMPSSDVRGYLKCWMEHHHIEQFIPLAHNWSFDRSFLGKLLGSKNCDKIFNRRARDSHSLAVAINDRYVLYGKEKPFESTSLQFLANYFGVDTTGAHRSEKDCEMTLIVYRKLLKFYLPT